MLKLIRAQDMEYICWKAKKKTLTKALVIKQLLHQAVLHDRKKSAVLCYKSGKVSFSQAAIISKVTSLEMFDILVKKGVEIGPARYEFGKGVGVLRRALKKKRETEEQV